MNGEELAKTLQNLARHEKDLKALSPHMQPELRDLFEALTKSSRDLALIADLCTEFPQQSTAEVVKSALQLLAKDNKSVPKLVQRVRVAKNEESLDLKQLRSDLQAATATDLKAIVKQLGGKAYGKQDALVAIDCFLRGEPLPAPPDPNAPKIEQAHRLFCEIQDQIDTLSIEEIRSRFSSIRQYTKPILQGLSTELGRGFTGIKSEIADKLFGILEGIKGSRMQTELIGAS